MSIYKDEASGELTLINSMRLSDAGLKELQAFGEIKNVIRVGGFHGRDDLFYQREFNAKVYAMEGQRYTRSMDDDAGKVEYMQPDVWVSSAADLPYSNWGLKMFKDSTPPEAAVLIPEHGGILVTADSMQNTPKPDQFVNFLMKIMMKKMGFWVPHNVGPAWIKFASPDKDGIRSVLELEFDHLLPGHGEAVIGNAVEKYRPVMETELKGC